MRASKPLPAPPAARMPAAGSRRPGAQALPTPSDRPRDGHDPAGAARPVDGDDGADLTDPALLADPLASEPLVHHPDGWYWLSPDGRERFGPFDSQAEALADLHAAELDELAPDELLSEAEAEIGIADWIDPDTGEPAEGQGQPHLPPD